MNDSAASRRSGERLADALPLGLRHAIGLAVAGCLALTMGLAAFAREIDHDRTEARFALRAERFFSALPHEIEGRLERLHHIAHLFDVSSLNREGMPAPPLHPAFPADSTDGVHDALSWLYWLPAEGTHDLPPLPASVRLDIPHAELESFRPAIDRAAKPGHVAFAVTPAGDRLLIAVALPAPNRPRQPIGHLLASLPVSDMIAHSRALAGLASDRVNVSLPGVNGERVPLGVHAVDGLAVDRRDVITRDIEILGTNWQVEVIADAPLMPWWQGPLVILTIGAGVVLACLVAWALWHLVRHAQTTGQSHQARLTELSGILRRTEIQARVAWRMLKDENVIDGYALWDEDERLVDYSGFLGRYLPQIAEWQRPTATQVVEALIHGGHVVIADGQTPDDAIAQMCMMRRAVPGLREVRMHDGQTFMARTVDLGENRQACIFNNVTELRAREEEKQASEALFRTAFESGPLIMILLDRDGQPVAVNRAFTSALGYTLERFAELGWKGILHPDDVVDGTPSTAAPWMPLIKRILAADGSVIRGQVRFTPVRDATGQREGRLLVTVEDRTSRWEAEERVRYQASLLDQVTNAVLAVDSWGRIVYGNRAAQALFQWTEQVMQGTPVNRLLGGEVATVLGHARAEIETEGTTWGGARFPAAVTVSRIVDDSGQAVGTVLVVTDLTQRRAMDMQLMHSARLATLGEMSASIAHEFNQCLHVIRLASEALRMDLADGKLDVKRVGKRSDNILSQVDRLTEMVTQMRSISRRETSGKKAFLPQAALNGAIRMVEPLMVGDAITLVRVGSLEGTPALGHQVRLEQVLINLLNNARDAIQDRAAADGSTGGTITVTCTVGEPAGRMSISIRDDGTGVPDTVTASIFEPFVTTKDGQRGCGLGLSISRGIIQEMGGSLGFQNLSPGAEFTIELPIADAVTAAPPAPSQSVQAQPPADDEIAATAVDDDDDLSLDRRRVLLVDDEALSVMMVGEFLERQGYAVDTAYDGQAALEKCEAQVYDTVITDIRMPRMDGRELIKRLEDLQPGTPVIVVTGHLKEGTESDLGANVMAVLPKPFQLLELRRHLSRVETGDWLITEHSVIDYEGV